MVICNAIEELIGNTPVLRLNGGLIPQGVNSGLKMSFFGGL
ncbi:TPA: cysteine synthase family protein, partial [Staphylococcus delphini]|nr:cysteine synthase family protein [Staphylococcus delphini]